ncbi:hypothetical protein QW180_08335 [Vibrio sinaloensis]|nr:hypothetical protein [Vibrio sinaloensis]
MLLKPEQPLNEVTRILKENGIDSALVELHEDDIRLLDDSHSLPFGIVTRTNMLHAVMLDDHPLDTPVGKIATFPVIHVDDGDFLFNAMIKMTRNRMKRVMVADGKRRSGYAGYDTDTQCFLYSFTRVDLKYCSSNQCRRARPCLESPASTGR